MKIDNEFFVPTPIEQTWQTLLDVPGIVGCVPGAELIAQESDTAFKGRVSVKLGPVALKFNGTAIIEEVDQDTHTALIRANGADQQGRGSAGTVTKMQVGPAEGGSTVTLETELQLSGLVAQYGRASGVIQAVSSTIISQFADNLRQQIVSDSEQSTSAPGVDEPSAPMPKENVVGGSLVWKIFLNWVRGLFGSSASK